MAELQREVPEKLEDLGDRIVIRHLYIERRMIPLNIYLEQADERQLHDAIEEYGNAIKQLAAANIFPGDMLFKNFGVTRHGRVVFYDYDEICYMTEVNFRDIPPPRYPEDEMASEPWYSVSPMMCFLKSSSISYAVMRELERCLPKCTVIYLLQTIGVVCSSGSVTAWLMMSLPIDVSADLHSVNQFGRRNVQGTVMCLPGCGALCRESNCCTAIRPPSA